MRNRYKFTTDAQFRLVDMDPRLMKRLSITKLNFPIDEYISRKHLPTFLGALLDAFRGKPVTDLLTEFLLPNKESVRLLVSMHALFDKRKHVTKIKGELIDIENCIG